MPPQALWTIAGLVIAIISLAGVTFTSVVSTDSSTTKLIASEAGNISVATKMWNIQKSSDGTFTGIHADGLVGLIQGMSTTSTGGASRSTSNAAAAVSYSVAVGSPASKGVITLGGMTAAQTPLVDTALTGRVCTMTHIDADTATYPCNS